jgi:hypothetical protein
MIIVHKKPLSVGQVTTLRRLNHNGEFHENVRAYVLREATVDEWEAMKDDDPKALNDRNLLRDFFPHLKHF